MANKQKGKFNKTHEHGKPSRGDKKQRRESVESFVEPLTPKTYKKEVKAATRAQFRPQQRELNAQARAEKESRSRTRDYFETYGKATDAAAATTKAAYDEAYNKINASGASASAADEAVRSKIESEAAADAERRGATYTPSTTSSQASASRRDSSAALAGVAATQGAASAKYLADKKRIGVGEKINQLRLSRKRSQTIAKDKEALAKEKGDFRTDYRSRTRESERQFYLQQQQLAQTAKGQKLSAKTSRKNAKLSARTQRRGQNVTARGQDISAANSARSAAETARHNRQTEAAARRDDRNRDTDKPTGDGQTVTRALSVLRTYGNSLDRRERASFTSQQGVDYLVSKGYSKEVAQKAVRRLSGGGGAPAPGGNTPGPAGP